MKQRFARFMYGRYGADEFSRFLSMASLAPILISTFLPGLARPLLVVLTLFMMIFAYVRMFSKNFEKRRAENAAYLRQKQRFTGWFGLRRDMWRQRREFRFFKCPSCRSVMRVPKGRGKIRIVCKKCGTAFEKKT